MRKIILSAGLAALAALSLAACKKPAPAADASASAAPAISEAVAVPASDAEALAPPSDAAALTSSDAPPPSRGDPTRQHGSGTN